MGVDIMKSAGLPTLLRLTGNRGGPNRCEPVVRLSARGKSGGSGIRERLLRPLENRLLYSRAAGSTSGGAVAPDNAGRTDAFGFQALF
jgi:hypothetical protein